MDCWGSIGPDAATIGMGGGFHHFGYSLVRDRTLSTSGTNVWEATFSSEDKDDTPLANISLPVSRHFTATGIKRMLEAAADDAIRNGREDAYEDKVTMELHLGDPAAAAAACAGWVKAHPDSWLARSTHAHLCCRMGESDAAAADFAAPGPKARHKPAQGEARNERSPGLPAETGQTLKGRDNLSAQPGITYNI